MNAYDLTGKKAIVTGGAGDIGRGIAHLMLASGASVSLWDVSHQGLETAAHELRRAWPGRIDIRAVDVTDPDAVSVAVTGERAANARLDVLVNNAGILGEVKPIWEVDPADFRKVLEVNLVGAFLCTRAILPIFQAQTPQPLRGQIINVSSIQGKEGMPRAAAYSASKAGLIALTKSAAKDVAGDRIVITCITPAAAETAMAKLLTTERRAEILDRIPMGRFVEIDEIARMVAWLASDDCTFSTGAVFDLSGGRATY